MLLVIFLIVFWLHGRKVRQKKFGEYKSWRSEDSFLDDGKWGGEETWTHALRGRERGLSQDFSPAQRRGGRGWGKGGVKNRNMGKRGDSKEAHMSGLSTWAEKSVLQRRRNSFIWYSSSRRVLTGKKYSQESESNEEAEFLRTLPNASHCAPCPEKFPNAPGSGRRTRAQLHGATCPPW